MKKLLFGIMFVWSFTSVSYAESLTLQSGLKKKMIHNACEENEDLIQYIEEVGFLELMNCRVEESGKTVFGKKKYAVRVDASLVPVPDCGESSEDYLWNVSIHDVPKKFFDQGLNLSKEYNKLLEKAVGYVVNYNYVQYSYTDLRPTKARVTIPVACSSDL